ncbi:putative Co/Zn/Cd efflux system membrane fusion protein [Labilithrix luteola]|uniref:Putative Co/Zn/Cd efflux system membrane fusion protein n=1 Tax=Labilithrix luteola TaxID=1391654 RepID=A0A0K1PJK0_9BACT|nr:efflux RND transporter periplasmic adaptor subunit [Labilithrix luteola]AKU93591.1 putative Co/Zn/Cd efflux system membrane fusion protein [Labilithrix luteola]
MSDVVDAPPRVRRFGVPIVVALAVAVVIATGMLLYFRAKHAVNHVALASSPKGVTVVPAVATSYRPSRQYVATVESWVEADVGPQLVAAYIDTVLVRPGATVRRGQVLATLDCRESAASHQAMAMQAQAIEARQRALADEARRVRSLLDGGFIAPNDVEQKHAGSESELAELLSTHAKLAGTLLVVDDCVLRAPFDGEIARRSADPGSFVRPGAMIVTVLDRSTVRVTADVPEVDFGVVAPKTPVKIHVSSVDEDLTGAITRRAPKASLSTRTVHVEIDLPNHGRDLPVGTTADLSIDVGEPKPATRIPGIAATVENDKATVYVVENGHAKKVVFPIQGEVAGTLYLDTSLAAGTLVVTEGRSLLADGDPVTAKVEAP